MSPKRDLWVLSPGPGSGILFGRRGTAAGSQVTMRPHCIRLGPSPATGVLTRSGKRGHGETTTGPWGRDWRDAPTGAGMPRAAAASAS